MEVEYIEKRSTGYYFEKNLPISDRPWDIIGGIITLEGLDTDMKTIKSIPLIIGKLKGASDIDITLLSYIDGDRKKEDVPKVPQTGYLGIFLVALIVSLSCIGLLSGSLVIAYFSVKKYKDKAKSKKGDYSHDDYLLGRQPTTSEDDDDAISKYSIRVFNIDEDNDEIDNDYNDDQYYDVVSAIDSRKNTNRNLAMYLNTRETGMLNIEDSYFGKWSNGPKTDR